MARSFSDTEYINLADNADQRGMNAITWACWFQRTGAGGASGDYFWGKPFDTDDGTWAFQISGSDFLRARITTSTSGNTTGTTTLSDDTWYHAAARWDASVDILYIFLDGAAEANSAHSGVNVNNGPDAQKDLFIGALTGSQSTRFMAGDVAECAMWARGLSDAEIAAVFRNGVRAVPTGLTVYIDVDGNPVTELELINDRGTLTHTGSPAKAAHPPRISTVGGRSFDVQPVSLAAAGPPVVGGVGEDQARFYYYDRKARRQVERV